jgi:hypothetical protein
VFSVRFPELPLFQNQWLSTSHRFRKKFIKM